VVGLKNVTMNEAFFIGHFPGYPIMPGVLIVEAMAQTGGVLVLSDVPDRERKLVLFAGIEEAKFRQPVVPGDQLRLELEVLTLRKTVVKMRAQATVDGRLVAEATIMCVIAEREKAVTSGK
jgi:3-hydroxyacyl-[acyl-carrier-protein] dehydratase